MTVVFVLGSHVRHDSTELPWRIASTPRQHERPVCTRCATEARKIAEAVL